MQRSRPLPSTIAIAAIMVFFSLIMVRWSWNEGPAIIRSDAMGYTAYLRALLITHDLGHERNDVTYVNLTPDGTLNKYFAGEAVMLAPFYLGGHVVAKLTGEEMDGLSMPYERAIGIAALCYAWLGLLAFRRVLRGVGSGERATTVMLLVTACGTQLVQYVSIQPGWSHVYSFCAISAFLMLVQRWQRSESALVPAACGVLFGLLVLIRPVNGLVLLALPVLFGTETGQFLQGLRARWRHTLLAMVCAWAVVSVQCLLWYAQVGHFVAYGYKGEGFHWDRPEFFQVLFGMRRGLFLWTPLMVPAALAALWLWRRDRIRAVGIAVYWLLNTYVIASWWIWYYGSGWGPRVFIDHYPVLLLPLALVLSPVAEDRSRPWKWYASIGALVGICAFTMAQFYQYDHRMLHVECMDGRKYAYSFLRFDDAHRDRLGGNYESPPYNPNGLDTLLHEKWDVEGHMPHWYGRALRMAGCPSPGHAAAIDRVEEFGLEFTMAASELPKNRAMYLAVGFERYAERVDDTRSVLCIATIEQADGTQSFYRSFAMEPMPPAADGAWEHIEYRILVPPLSEGEHLKFYFWNQGNLGRFRADDLDMTVMAVIPY